MDYNFRCPICGHKISVYEAVKHRELKHKKISWNNFKVLTIQQITGQPMSGTQRMIKAKNQNKNRRITIVSGGRVK